MGTDGQRPRSPHEHGTGEERRSRQCSFKQVLGRLPHARCRSTTGARAAERSLPCGFSLLGGGTHDRQLTEGQVSGRCRRENKARQVTGKVSPKATN